MSRSPCERNERTIQVHEVGLIVPIQGIGIYAHCMVLVLPQIYLSHPRGLLSRNVSNCNGSSHHNREGKPVSRRRLVHGGASETWGKRLHRIPASVVFSIATKSRQPSTRLYSTVLEFWYTNCWTHFRLGDLSRERNRNVSAYSNTKAHSM